MSRTPARFTEADLRRAVRAVKKEGAVMAVEIAPDGTIRIVPHRETIIGGATGLGELAPSGDIRL